MEKAVKAYTRGDYEEDDIPGMDEFSQGWHVNRVQFLKDLNKMLEAIATSLKYLEGADP